MNTIVTTDRIRFQKALREWQDTECPPAHVHSSPPMQGPDVNGAFRFMFHGYEDTLKALLKARPEWVGSVE